MTDTLSDTYSKVTTWIVNLLGANPWIIPTWIAILALNNAARVNARGADRRNVPVPQWAALVIGATDPFVGNFWRMVEWASLKAGLPIHGPDADGSAVVTPPEKPTPLPKEPVPQASIDKAEAKP